MKPYVIEDIDLKNITPEYGKELEKLAYNHSVIYIPNQDLEPQEQTDACALIGEVEFVPYKSDFMIDNHVMRIAADNGIFGHTQELDWHVDLASVPSDSPMKDYQRRDFVMLHAIAGTDGSVTSFIDMAQAYEDLDSDFIKFYDLPNCCITTGFRGDTYSPDCYKFFHEHHNEERLYQLVYTNPVGRTGLFFPYLQVFGIVGHTDKEQQEITDYLTKHIMKPEFRYDHRWKDGDVIINEQWLTLHKRWEFDDAKKRVVHRVGFGNR